MKSSIDKVTYIITTGITPEAVISSIWAYLDKEHINKLILLSSEKALDKAEQIADITKEVFGISLVQIEIIDETEIRSSIQKITEIMSKEKNEGNKIIVDITPGRKTMSIALYAAAREKNADKILYLHLKDTSYQRTLYPEIPKSQVNLVNLIE